MVTSEYSAPENNGVVLAFNITWENQAQPSGEAWSDVLCGLNGYLPSSKARLSDINGNTCGSQVTWGSSDVPQTDEPEQTAEETPAAATDNSTTADAGATKEVAPGARFLQTKKKATKVTAAKPKKATTKKKTTKKSTKKSSKKSKKTKTMVKAKPKAAPKPDGVTTTLYLQSSGAFNDYSVESSAITAYINSPQFLIDISAVTNDGPFGNARRVSPPVVFETNTVEWMSEASAKTTEDSLTLYGSLSGDGTLYALVAKGRPQDEAKPAV